MVALLTIACVSLLLGIYLRSERQAAMDSGYALARQGADFTALATSGALDNARQLLRSMAVLARQTTSGGKPDPEVRKTLLDWREEGPYIMDLLILDGHGTIVDWTGQGSVPDIHDRPYVTAHVDQARSGLHLGLPLLSKVHEGQWFVALSEGLRDSQDHLNNVVVAILDLNLLRDRLHVPSAITGSTQALLGEDGTVYMRTPDHDKHVGKQVNRPSEFESLSDSTPQAIFELTSQLDGRPRILAFHKLHGYPLIAAGTIDIDELLAPWRKHVVVVVAIWLLIVCGILWTTSQLHRDRKALAELASIDSLTGTYNRRSILDAATIYERSRAQAGSLSILMIDVDHFKIVNDRFGHAVGDEVLRQLSDVLGRNVRAHDIVGRYGGEEFLVLLPDTGLAGALNVAEKQRAAVESQLTRPMQITISVGVATTRVGDFNLDRTLAQADAALYAAKAAGRNCVRSEAVQHEKQA